MDTTRPTLARARAVAALQALHNCRLCAHDCGVDRFIGAAGRCRAGTVARYHVAQVDLNDEPELAPCFAVALSGCDLRCDFCITGAASWNARAGMLFDAASMAERAVNALASCARSVMILGGEPTVHLHAALDLVAHLPADAMLVWKTNAHASAGARALLDGLFDVWVVDYKFGNDACARRLAHVERYTAVVRENLRWAADHTRLIVRHLLMPGHVKCCWEPVAQWIARELPEVKVSLRGGFWPGWQSHRHPELGRTTSRDEFEQAQVIAKRYGLTLSSNDSRVAASRQSAANQTPAEWRCSAETPLRDAWSPCAT